MPDEKQIAQLLLNMGIQPHLTGYKCLITAISTVQNGNSIPKNITSTILPEVAKVHKTTVSAVDRCIRHCLDKASDHPNPTWIKVIGQYMDVDETPKLGLFLAYVVEALRLELVVVD